MDRIDLRETQEELQWLEQKLEIKARRLRGSSRSAVKRGQVYGCDFGYNIGTELRGYHPCLIVESNVTSGSRQSVCVAPITHAANRTHLPPSLVPITTQSDENGNTILEGYVDVAGMRVVSKARLTRLKAELPRSDMLLVEKAMASLTGLYGHYADMQKKYITAQKRGDAKEDKIRKMRALLLRIEADTSLALPSMLREELEETLKL